MKKKFSLWLNIVTICLCVCAIAIGVYAATSATLTVTGQIGFTAHGCDIDASGYVYGHAAGDTLEAMKNGMPVAAPTQDSEKVKLTDKGADSTPNVVEVRGNTSETLDIGDRYFTDMNNDPTGKPTDIVIVLTITNQSLFDVHGIITTTTKDENILITQSAGLLELNKKTGTGENVQIDSTNITITLSVKPDTEGNYNGITATPNNVTISIEFNKGKAIKEDLTTGYYLEMGTENGQANGTPLRWYAFAKADSDGVFASHTKTSEVTAGSYYFISEKALLPNGVTWGAYNVDSPTHGVDYGTESNVQKLVNGTGTDSVYDTYGLENFVIYNAIQKRTLPSESYTWYPNAHNSDYKTKETKTTNITPNQTLWLLSHSDVINFLPMADRMANSVSGSSSTYNNCDYWWLSSPLDVYSSNDMRTYFIDNYGYIHFDPNLYIDAGLVPSIRPAFQLDIA